MNEKEKTWKNKEKELYAVGVMPNAESWCIQRMESWLR
jgi:hypothetical protein